ncbi:hypothetical protein [Micromonospora aurantiaca (nom. illeg.)]|uniref:hypothetical protein n=1 Tax=Micromonospora aurantiaca (nom. illeg.) TaxID=47850 RepID=UPI003F4A7E0C
MATGVTGGDPAKANVPSAWQDLTLGANIVAPGVGFPSPQARLDPGRIVRLKGRLTWGAVTISAGATIATVPAGLRPAETVTFCVRTSGGNISTNLTVDPLGVITGLNALNAGQAGFVALDGMTYPQA